MVTSAQSIIENNALKMDQLLNYSFNENWISEVEDLLGVLSKTDENFPYISIVQKDSIRKLAVFLEFQNYYGSRTDSIPPEKKDYIFKTTQPEREYLDAIFDSNNTNIRFSADEGRYELYYPYQKNGKKMVIYFSDQQNYGSFGK